MNRCKLVTFLLSMVLVQIMTLLTVPVTLASNANFSSHLALPGKNGNGPVYDIYGGEVKYGVEHYIIMSATAHAPYFLGPVFASGQIGSRSRLCPELIAAREGRYGQPVIFSPNDNQTPKLFQNTPMNIKFSPRGRARRKQCASQNTWKVNNGCFDVINVVNDGSNISITNSFEMEQISYEGDYRIYSCQPKAGCMNVGFDKIRGNSILTLKNNNNVDAFRLIPVSVAK